MTAQPVVAIVGAGFSGSLLALHLLSSGPAAPKVFLVERARGFGKGVAYATGHPGHLLNVRAANMSAFPDRPNHFLDWLREQPDGTVAGGPVGPASFVPRQTYGAYLQDMLSRAVRAPGAVGRLVLVPDDAVSLCRTGKGLELTVAMGRTYQVDACVLAVGNFPPELPGCVDPSFHASPRYHGDPWAPGSLDNIGTLDRVLLVGTGLTMVDMVLALRARGHHGRVLALSRRGLLPRQHAPAFPQVAPLPPPLPGSLSGALRAVRGRVRAEVAAGRSWHAVVDSLRPLTRAYWQDLEPDAKARFLRHLRPWWDVHRHRLAPEVAQAVDAMRAAGRLTVVAGRLKRLEDTGNGVSVRWAPRGGGPAEETAVDHVINCAGPSCDVTRVSDPLVQSLLRDGLGRPDPYHLGLDITNAGQLLRQDGGTTPGLYAIGPVTRGAFWEMTAVPDIRVQAQALARTLGDALRRHRVPGDCRPGQGLREAAAPPEG